MTIRDTAFCSANNHYRDVTRNMRSALTPFSVG